jgi:hypothetical protein
MSYLRRFNLDFSLSHYCRRLFAVPRQKAQLTSAIPKIRKG